MGKIELELKKLENKEKAALLARFFKTGKGEYGDGDRFLGVTVPTQRKVAKKYVNLPVKELSLGISSKWHEVRLTTLIALTYAYEKGDDKKREDIYKTYLKNTRYINNWDIVDVTAPRIVGAWLFLKKPRTELYTLAKSRSLWERRIAIISTLYFIKKGDTEDTMAISELLLSDKHDLIHKAVGWMLREVGKVNEVALLRFLDKHKTKMPRTMLRYSIEKLPVILRAKYLAR